VPRWFSIVIPVVAFMVVGVLVPLAVLIWLLAHHEPPYVLDRAALGSARTALGGDPVTLKPVTGTLAFIAPSAPALERLVSQSALRRNAKRDVGNTVLDDHGATATLVGLGWFFAALALATIAVVRGASSMIAAQREGRAA
jgi:hypothetical protein